MELSSAVGVSCAGVGRRFLTRGHDVVALDDVDVTAAAGSLVAIAGPSGSGKSTLLAIIGCLDRPTSGTVALLDRPVQDLSRRDRRALRRTVVTTVLPDPAANVLTGLTGRENVELAAAGFAEPPAIDAAISRVGAHGFADRVAGALSGGEQQRIALACAVARRCPVIVVDEPTSALDRTSAAEVVDALRATADSGVTVIVATHDHMVIDAASTVIRLDHGRVVE